MNSRRLGYGSLEVANERKRDNEYVLVNSKEWENSEENKECRLGGVSLPGPRLRQRPWAASLTAIAIVAVTIGLANIATSPRGDNLLPLGGEEVTLNEIPKSVGGGDRVTEVKEQVDNRLKFGSAYDTHHSNPSMTFSVSNRYSRRGDKIGEGYPWLLDKKLVEPYRDTRFEVSNPLEGMQYRWTTTPGKGDGAENVVTGNSVEMQLRIIGEHNVTLEELSTGKDGQTTIVRSLTETVIVKYVRREIRSLFDDDRNAMFDAMKVLWEVPYEEGKEIYGEDYVDIWTVDHLHQVGASDVQCDHLHDGIGFGITHSLVTMVFEGSMQLVDPEVSLPYWDFTIEGEQIMRNHDGNFSMIPEVSDLWTDDWFGGMDSADYQLKDSRWGYTEIPHVEKDDRDDLRPNVFGMLKSPWNTSGRKYISRGMGEMCGIQSWNYYPWPTCKAHYELTNSYTSYYSWVWESQYDPHGPVHVWIGGTLDCKEMFTEIEKIVGTELSLYIRGIAFIIRKNAYRDGLFKCQGQADSAMSVKDVMNTGLCGCLDYDLEQGEDFQEVNRIMLGDLYETLMRDQTLLLEDARRLAQLLCNGALSMGESVQSSSPLDPTFWSLHPTMERLLMFKRLTNSMTDLSWPDNPGIWVGDDGVEYDVTISLEFEQCVGHRGSDIFPYGILDNSFNPRLNFFGELGVNTYTNRELVTAFDPRIDALPYIFDDFEWPHCEGGDFDMKSLLNPSGQGGVGGGGGGGKGERGTEGATGMGAVSSAVEEESKEKKTHGYGVFRAGEPRRPRYKSVLKYF